MSDEVAKVVGFGHPLLDISSHVDKGFLDRFGVEVGSCNLASEEQLAIFEELSQRRDVDFVPGGACMNTMRVCRWVLRQDVCTFVGALGDDEFGCILERALSRAGVKSIFQREEEKATGTCAVMVTDGERSLLANIAAALELNMKHMESPEVQAAIKDAGIFYLEGFFMNVVSAPASSVMIGEACKRGRKLLTMNLSAPYLCHIFKERFAAILPYVNILFGSSIDFAAYAESVGWSAVDLPEVLQRIVAMPCVSSSAPRIVVMTNGSQPTLVAASAADPVKEYPTLSVPPDRIVDTNGAGDAFVGGFLSSFARRKPIEDCVAAGHMCAAIVIQQNGCTTPDKVPDALLK